MTSLLLVLAQRLEEKEKHMRFSVGKDSGGKDTWWLYGANNKLVAWAGESFASAFNAQRAAKSFRTGAKTARYEIYLDGSGAYRWRAWRSSDKVASSGESFSSRAAAQMAADNVRDNAGGASGPPEA
jgi:uncharacterized protein YegP (UPF0339 family)